MTRTRRCCEPEERGGQRSMSVEARDGDTLEEIVRPSVVLCCNHFRPTIFRLNLLLCPVRLVQHGCTN